MATLGRPGLSNDDTVGVQFETNLHVNSDVAIVFSREATAAYSLGRQPEEDNGEDVEPRSGGSKLGANLPPLRGSTSSVRTPFLG